ncbi:uncharacterized protein LOC112342157 [Selaginella moellendorffii]|uniref:uncharacterized protein LOC112342157 n=1 Tax=Selaginella moellendorffii TaxID=88036 RepID=UPI000D1CB224|nr:uncharacterized protein LOC112342157 [Selaginella moellendorffii]|eukprot:XP_024519291.1 uncharacterized protein LOC112342157 [Selaginella moellendorffii]
MARWLYGLRNCELSSQLAQQGIEGEKKKDVLDALHSASDDDPVLVFFWNQDALDQTGVANAKQVLLTALRGVVPTVTRSVHFPDEVFNLEHLNDFYTMRDEVIMRRVWARGDVPGAPPIFNRPIIARTLLITDTKKKIPTFSDVGLFT